MSEILITNNSLVLERLSDKYKTEFIDGSLDDVFETLRALIHKGHRLLTHPLSGSVKPNQTPYKSVLISSDRGELDLNSLMIIENSIETLKKLPKRPESYPDRILDDFKTVDLSLIESVKTT
ncbi:GrdX family protein [Clostridiaceae bacterium OttesenSCG-928-D20]|nr:GrdX family protein [Clostridiaceae bacterium OttesenSCG-928-D20]